MIEKNSEFVRLKKRAEYISDMSRDAVMQSRQGSPYICDRSLGLYCDRTWIFADDNVFEVLDSVMDENLSTPKKYIKNELLSKIANDINRGNMAGMGGRRFTDIVVIGHMIRDRTNHVVSMIPNNQKNIMPIYFIGHNLADFDLVRARCRPENTLVLMLSDSNPSTNPMYQMVYDWLHKTAQGMAHNHILVLGPKSDEFLQFQKKADKIIECLELDIHMFLIELASSNMFVDSVMIGANSENHILAKRILQFVLWEIDINRNSSVRLNGMPGACQLLMHSMSDSDLIWDTVSNMDRPQILITNRDDRMLDAVSNLSDQTSLMLVSPNKSVAEFMGLFMAACDQIKNAISKLYPPKKPGKTYKISESVINNWVLKCLGENK